MGNSASGEDGYVDDGDDYAKQFDGIETLGYRVLGVQPDSPASKAGLVSFFDFIVGANHQMLLGSGTELEEGDEYDDIDFPHLLRENLHKPVLLLVYNIKAREKRVVELVPSDDWKGAGLLGVTIKLDDYGGADERLVRVLEVDDSSDSGTGPAGLAGLVPKEDFLLGTAATTLTNTDVLASLLHHHLGGVVELYVYNSSTDLVRVVGLHPTYSWGNRESMLGAAVGTGYLHRLPESCRSTIGKSVERTVSIQQPLQQPLLELNESNIKMEPTLEMEMEAVDGEELDGDVGLAAARGVQVQPHSLGRADFSTPQAKIKKDPPSSSSSSSSDRAPVPMEEQRQQQQQQQQQKQPPTPSPINNSQILQQQQQEQPPPPPSPVATAATNSSPLPHPPPPPPPHAETPTTATFSSPPPPPPPPVAVPTEASNVFAQPPPAFPGASPVVTTPQQQKQQQQQQQHLPPPPPEAAFVPPPPTPPPQDPPGAEEVGQHHGGDDGDGGEYTDGDEEGSEYTDDEEGSEYTDDEGEDDDEPETPDQPKRGLFGFMAPPPKMTY